jgi:hypothetical protein
MRKRKKREPDSLSENGKPGNEYNSGEQGQKNADMKNRNAESSGI